MKKRYKFDRGRHSVYTLNYHLIICVKYRRRAWDNDINGINYTKQQNDLPAIRDKYPEHKWIYSKVLQMFLKTLDADYNSFFALRKNGDENAQPPKFTGHKYFMTMVHDRSGFKVGDGFVELSQFYNDIPLRFELPEIFKFEKVYQVSIFQDRTKWFVSIV